MKFIIFYKLLFRLNTEWVDGVLSLYCILCWMHIAPVLFWFLFYFCSVILSSSWSQATNNALELVRTNDAHCKHVITSHIRGLWRKSIWIDEPDHESVKNAQLNAIQWAINVPWLYRRKKCFSYGKKLSDSLQRLNVIIFFCNFSWLECIFTNIIFKIKL